jgi:hypothetical protein
MRYIDTYQTIILIQGTVTEMIKKFRVVKES